MLITILGAGCGHYIGSCLAGNRPLNSMETDGPFCFESDRITSLPPIFMQQPGLQYRDVSPLKDDSSPATPSTPLQQCKESLYDAVRLFEFTHFITFGKTIFRKPKLK